MGSDQEQFARSGLWPFAPATRDSGMEIRLLTAIRAARAKASPRSTNVGVAVWSKLCRRPVAGGASPREEGRPWLPGKSRPIQCRARSRPARRAPAALVGDPILPKSCDKQPRSAAARNRSCTRPFSRLFNRKAGSRCKLAVFYSGPILALNFRLLGKGAAAARRHGPLRLGQWLGPPGGAGAALFRRPKAGAGASSIGGGIGRGDR